MNSHYKRQFSTLVTLAIASCTLLPASNLEYAIEHEQNLANKNIRITISKAFPEVPEFTNGALQVGNGDCFQFMVYAEYLQQLGAHVVIDLPTKLKKYFLKTTTLPLSDTADTRNFEEIQLADLFNILKNRVPNFKRNKPFFTCPEELILKWDAEIKKRTAGKLIPVIIFTDGAAHHPERFPQHHEWLELIQNTQGILFINAQFNGPVIDGSIRTSDIDPWYDKEIPYLDTMALIYAVTVLNKGFVISPDTGSLHLSASGVEGCSEAHGRVLGLLAHHPDQRWRLTEVMTTIAEQDGVKINTCAWYPQSVLLFQQTEPGNYLPAMRALQAHIMHMKFTETHPVH